nr:DNA helicase [Tanacetum cinerariifolium]
MHGPCGAANLDASCMQEGSCNKHFPKNYNDTTFFDPNGHTQYQRRDTGVHVMKGKSKLDNCNVILYNHALCLAFEAHINVEYCGWMKTDQNEEVAWKTNLRSNLFYFRMLLCHQKGCRSPIELRTVSGQILPTYRAACKALVASSGIASILLPARRTTHSRFKLPLESTDESLCHAKKSIRELISGNRSHYLGRSPDERHALF